MDFRPAPRAPPTESGRSALRIDYVDRFNQRDWDGVRELIAADARLQVGDAFGIG